MYKLKHQDSLIVKPHLLKSYNLLIINLSYTNLSHIFLKRGAGGE